MLSFIISYSDLIKFPYFADTFERGDKGGVKAGPKRGGLYGGYNSIIISWYFLQILELEGFEKSEKSFFKDRY